jgi:hypothetical protein
LQSTQVLTKDLGADGTGGGLEPLYQLGGTPEISFEMENE